MAPLRGWLQGRGQTVTRNAHGSISCGAGTWNGKAALTVDADGAARLTVENDRHGPREVWAGNVERQVDTHGRQLVRTASGVDHLYEVRTQYMRGEGRWLTQISTALSGVTMGSAYGTTEAASIAGAFEQLGLDDTPPATGPAVGALRIACPTCGAPVGQPCMPCSLTAPHAARAIAAEARDDG